MKPVSCPGFGGRANTMPATAECAKNSSPSGKIEQQHFAIRRSLCRNLKLLLIIRSNRIAAPERLPIHRHLAMNHLQPRMPLAPKLIRQALPRRKLGNRNAGILVDRRRPRCVVQVMERRVRGDCPCRRRPLPPRRAVSGSLFENLPGSDPEAASGSET